MKFMNWIHINGIKKKAKINELFQKQMIQNVKSKSWAWSGGPISSSCGSSTAEENQSAPGFKSLSADGHDLSCLLKELSGVCQSVCLFWVYFSFQSPCREQLLWGFVAHAPRSLCSRQDPFTKICFGKRGKWCQKQSSIMPSLLWTNQTNKLIPVLFCNSPPDTGFVSSNKAFSRLSGW